MILLFLLNAALGPARASLQATFLRRVAPHVSTPDRIIRTALRCGGPRPPRVCFVSSSPASTWARATWSSSHSSVALFDLPLLLATDSAVSLPASAAPPRDTSALHASSLPAAAACISGV
ncbi:Os02g0457600 [Oryza sativa Japonica Group]|uniref:Os02g0457600 protein n=2 Tax=Oryza sativa subsp. japonica TaxID=39947 RepID=Q0E1E5_ORYSJ|nr:hypothetical protein EE612_011141 [Oryza sativa]BAF08693.1 Os02g0457600 [Oryza sativa Japonica Group]BAS78534.1 Os02g0457600 [Oryza sativa Japonica Group]|eukprot:NP_001046779.1 Os02g0457600 [Oryza sativa Japonica Group]